MKKIFYISCHIAAVCFLLEASCNAQPMPCKAAENGVVFAYEGAEVNAVNVAGEFNGWDQSQYALKKDEKTGVWSAVVPVTAGRYEYKFIIDGEWMQGANLALELKKDKQGKLFVPESKAGPNTLFSGKIRFGGNLIGVMNHRYYSDENRYRLDRPRFHLDWDWDVSITKQIGGFMRIEMDSYETKSLTANLFKSHLDIEPEWFSLRLFNNEKTVQFDNPSRFANKDVSLRYDTLEFFDEPNLNRSLGQKSQGLRFDSSPLGWFDLQGFYLNKSNSDQTLNRVNGSVDNFSEDNWGVRVKKIFGEIFGVGFTHFARTGMKWPYADSNNWFPDPATLQGRDISNAYRYANLPDGKPPESFKGWLNRNDTAFDAKLQAFSDFWLFAEYAVSSEYLDAALRNGRVSGHDKATDASWKIFRRNRILGGVKTKWFDRLSMEVSYSGSNTDLGNIMDDTMAREYSGKGDKVSGKLLFDDKKWGMGVAISGMRQDIFGQTGPSGFVVRDEGVLPNEQPLRFFNYATSAPVNALVEKDFLVQPFLKANFGDRFEGRVFGNFHIYKVQPSSAAYLSDSRGSGVVQRAKPDLFSSQSYTLNHYELLADFILKITGPLYLQNSSRYAQWTSDFSASSAKSFSTYAALVYKFRKNILLRLGWGVDPESYDEDLREDFDLREKFLYDRYTEALSRGEVAERAIATAEHDLEKEKRFSLRIEIKY